MNPHLALVHAQRLMSPMIVVGAFFVIALCYFVEYHRELSAFKTHQVFVGAMLEAAKDMVAAFAWAAVLMIVTIIFSFALAGQQSVRTSDFVVTAVNVVVCLWPVMAFGWYLLKRWQRAPVAAYTPATSVDTTSAIPGVVSPLPRAPQGWSTLEDIPKI